ncbi:GtrA family protein [Faecalibaculum rodentium]|uniref:GtrA family protein n=1 Tax=Faecalibaculum rodentium TaxID=1702221 RepID=UPI001F57A098|nr:GtrA family protein [Faecalibaculum rodentium]
MEKIANIYRKNREVINYLIFGVLTTLVNIAAFTICVDVLHVQYLISNVIAWILSVLFAYITNRRYVFNSAAVNVGWEIIKFFSSRLSTLALDMAVMWFMVGILQTNNLIAKIIANVLVVIANYVLSKIFVFTGGTAK